jgi:hypothetical protein
MPRAPLLQFSFAAGLAALSLVSVTAPASAQSSSCQEGQKFLGERQSIGQQISKLAGKDKKIDPRPACTLFTKLVANGEATIKWMDANKDWCQVPDLAVTNFKTEHQSVSKTKGQACQAAAKMAAMEKQARQAQQQQQKGGGMLGGPGLTGQYKVPQGAL